MKSTWSVLVVYENAHARERAVQFSDRLVERFWAQCGFDVAWCAYNTLEDGKQAGEFCVKAGDADLIVFAHESQRDLPWAVKAWVETWVKLRSEREGKLVWLTGPQSHNHSVASNHLRHVSHRAGMDFVTELPQEVLDSLPDSPDMALNRAHQVTSLLDSILRRPPPPPSL